MQALEKPTAEIKRVLKVNPKQLKFVEYYYLPGSETIGNIYQSAVKAGFSKSYARVMTVSIRNTKWLTHAKKYMTRLEPEHILAGLEHEALYGAQSRDRITALTTLGKAAGLFIERNQTEVTVNFTNSVPRPHIASIEVIDIEPTQ